MPNCKEVIKAFESADKAGDRSAPESGVKRKQQQESVSDDMRLEQAHRSAIVGGDRRAKEMVALKLAVGRDSARRYAFILLQGKGVTSKLYRSYVAGQRANGYTALGDNLDKADAPPIIQYNAHPFCLSN
jgi:hypothetical protein